MSCSHHNHLVWLTSTNHVFFSECNQISYMSKKTEDSWRLEDEVNVDDYQWKIP